MKLIRLFNFKVFQSGFRCTQLRGISRNGCFRLSHFIARNCAIIATRKQLNIATELLFHLKINDFNCDLRIFAESENGNISVDFKIIKA